MRYCVGLYNLNAACLMPVVDIKTEQKQYLGVELCNMFHMTPSAMVISRNILLLLFDICIYEKESPLT